ncbi:MAG: DegV family protein [Anaerolineae bacterium]|nr:DegV family protein [Anaerolineae bacterium]
MGIKIVTDSGCDLPGEMESGLDIQYVPLIFRFGMEEYADKSIPMKTFLEMVSKTWPYTSAPSPGDYNRVFRQCLDHDDQIICITLTSKHSTSYSSALLASGQFPPGQVTVIDSLSLSIGQGLQVRAAAQAAQRGESVASITAMLNDLQQRSKLYIILDTLEYLVRGGRAGHLAGIVASILKIRPVLTLVNGQLTLLEKPRGRNASKQRLLELALQNFPAEAVLVGHVDCEEEAREIAASLAQQSGMPLENIPFVETGMAIATHGGPGTLGIVAIPR